MSNLGFVHHIGEQREIFKSGRADASISLTELSGLADLYALGPVAGLDGEITIFNSRAYVSQVRGGADAYTVDRTFSHGAIFLAWAQVREWEDTQVPDSVSNNRALEGFVMQAAQMHGIELDVPFPFLMSGRAHEIVWHINVDRTDGRPITRELFRKSKQPYILRRESVDIFGVYSDRHGGVFMGEDMKIHIHFVSRDTAATGHIDDISPGSLTLRLPRRAEA